MYVKLIGFACCELLMGTCAQAAVLFSTTDPARFAAAVAASGRPTFTTNFSGLDERSFADSPSFLAGTEGEARFLEGSSYQTIPSLIAQTSPASFPGATSLEIMSLSGARNYRRGLTAIGLSFGLTGLGGWAPIAGFARIEGDRGRFGDYVDFGSAFTFYGVITDQPFTFLSVHFQIWDRASSSLAFPTLDSLTVAVAPVPAALPLLATALGGLGLRARRRARA